MNQKLVIPGKISICTYILGVVILLSCDTPKTKSFPLFRLLSPQKTGVAFSNSLYEDEQLNIINFEYFYNGAGVAIGDINNDGLQDVFFTGNMVPSKLYLNTGQLTFNDITLSSGIDTKDHWATGVSMVDINQDGYLDIYVCLAGPYDSSKRKNQFYINQGDNTFRDLATEMGLDDPGHTTMAAFFDYDKDGDLDVYLLTNITDKLGPNVIRPKKLHGEAPNTDKLFRNDEGTFTNVSQLAGITREGYGLGISIRDINQDSWPDIYISNDYVSNDLLYINNQDGTFTDKATEYFRHTSYSAMGNDIVDINNDGLQDIVTMDMLPPDNKRRKLMINSINYDRHRSELIAGYDPQYMRNTLQLNQGVTPTGQPVFSEIGQMLEIHSTDWSWSVLGADLDNDRDNDLLITNGYPRDITNLDFVAYKMSELTRASYNPEMNQAFVQAINTIEGAYLPNYLFENQGNLSFSEQSTQWGFLQPSYSHGASLGDLDNDGDLDIVINNTQDPVFIYENQSNTLTENHYLRIKLMGPEKNVMGIGTKITIYHDSVKQFTEFSPYRGFQSTLEPIVHFGLGETSLIDSMVVIWPDNNKQSLYNIPSDQLLKVVYPLSTTLRYSQNQNTTYPLIQSAKGKFNIPFKHKEEHYADFKIQPLIPHKFSQSGPGISTGDINGDQLIDFFVGGAFNQSGEYLIQNPNGNFTPKSLTNSQSFEEDLGSLLFDADNDGDLDLYVVSGGSEFTASSRYYQDRLYKNEGSGYFTLDTTSIPIITSSGSCIAATDFDNDGDLDLFVGGKITPNNYPQPGTSLLLENQNGTFKDVTSEICPELKNIGIVNSALWTDINDDGQMDLIVAGEWMPVTIFIHQQGRLINQTEAISCKFTHLNEMHSLGQTVGWWNSIMGADFDQDGDTDYILGNLGLNTPFKTSFSEPVRLYVNDFNMDDKRDPILCHFIQGKEVPFHPKDDMVQQMYTLRKITPTYTDFATASLKELFPSEVIEYATVYEANIFESVYLENKGNLQFELTPLPKEAQIAPVYGIEVLDINQDTYQDIILTGNSYATETMTGRYDASMGLVMLGDGKGQFNPLSIQESGFFFPKDGKSLSVIPVNNTPLILAAANNDSLEAFVLTNAEELTWNSVEQDVRTVFIAYESGRTEKQELYTGSGYLSQRPSGFWVTGRPLNITTVNDKGEKKVVLNRSSF